MSRQPLNRLPAIGAVIAVHALVVFGFASRHRETTSADLGPMEATIIEAASEQPEMPLPPQPLMETPDVQVVEPVVSITLDEPPPAPMVVLHAPQPQAATREPIVEARFDADYLKNPNPIYPQVSRRLHEQGVVVLKVRVGADGASDAIVLHQSSGSARLDDAALAAVKRWRFVPAKRGALAVDSWVLVPIEFALGA